MLLLDYILMGNYRFPNITPSLKYVNISFPTCSLIFEAWIADPLDLQLTLLELNLFLMFLGDIIV